MHFLIETLSLLVLPPHLFSFWDGSNIVNTVFIPHTGSRTLAIIFWATVVRENLPKRKKSILIKEWKSI